MKIKKILAAVAAAAMAISMVAINAFATTIELDSEYPGAWASSKNIPKSELEAIGGDVKVVLTVEVKEPLIGEHNHLAKPMDVNWNQVTDRLTSDTMIAKADGFMVFAEGQTSVDFVIPADLIAELDDNGLAFQVSDVIIKSAELTLADGPAAEIRRVDESQSAEIMTGKSYEEVTGGAAPAPEAGSSDAPATGNVPVAAVASVMAVAGVAAVASRKRK